MGRVSRCGRFRAAVPERKFRQFRGGGYGLRYARDCYRSMWDRAHRKWPHGPCGPIRFERRRWRPENAARKLRSRVAIP